jgi:hypothetical protein
MSSIKVLNLFRRLAIFSLFVCASYYFQIMGVNSTNKALYLLIWRWHFFAGLYVLPFMLMLYFWLVEWVCRDKSTGINKVKL